MPSETGTRERLLRGLIDDAALFPPAGRSMARATADHARIRRSPESWMLNRFLCPASRLDELVEHAPEDGTWSVGVVLDGPSPHDDLATIRRSRIATCVRVLEPRLAPDATPDAAARLAGALLEGLPGAAAFIEITARDTASLRAQMGALAQVDARGVLGAKLRCGGLAADAFPSDTLVAAFITAAQDLQLPFKLTAGLHHPFRTRDATIGVLQHGFVNLLAATALPAADIVPIIAELDPAAFALTADGLRWREHLADADALDRARSLLTGMGSCSFDEPVAELRSAGFLPALATVGRTRATELATRAAQTGFGLANLPYGLAEVDGDPRPVIRFGHDVLDLRALGRSGLLPPAPPWWEAGDLHTLLALDPRDWDDVRRQVTALLEGEITPDVQAALRPAQATKMLAPVDPGDFVDFYASLQHASNLGRIFRPDSDPLLPNWRHLPVGYHGRAASIVASGTQITRPCGQTAPDIPGGPPGFGPEPMLDFELELGCVIGGRPTGSVVPDQAGTHIFGVLLVNDWSARGIQRWEYQPLGPFLGKSFATSVSPWIVPLAALEPFRVEGPNQTPLPLPYLQAEEPWGLDIDLEIDLAPADGGPATRISRTNARHLYWTMAQQIAHASVNGARLRPGDLFATGTISGPEPGSYGSMIELSWGGERPITVGSSSRSFLHDGDTVLMRGHARRAAHELVSLGEVSGTIAPAPVAGSVSAATA